MTSNALLTRVAESIVIFGPIRQVGCARASSGVTDASSLAARPRNGPPLAVRTRRATSSIRSPTRHCQMAECSLSIGRRWSRRSPPSRSSSTSTRWPPVTSVSLLARATRRQARRAVRTAGSAAIPVVATTTSSTPSSVASSSRPPSAHRLPPIVSGWPPSHQARAFGYSRSCASKASLGCPDASARTSNRSGCAETTSSVWRPIDPVEPRTATPVTRRGRPRASRSRRGRGRRTGTSRSGRACRRDRG